MAPTKYLLALFLFIGLSLFQHKHHIVKDIQGIHGWRQSQTMWGIRNFARHDSNIFNPRLNSFNGGRDNIRRFEFPIMQWSLAMVQKVLGEEIALLRILIFIIGIFSILGIFFLLHFLTNNWLTALITAILFQYSPVFFYYTINPLPDNLALCGIIWYTYYIVKYFKTYKNRHLLFANIALSIAALTKLNFLMFSIIGIFYLLAQVVKHKKINLENVKFAFVHLIFAVPALAWYAWVIPQWGSNPVLYGILDGNFVLQEYLDLIYFHATHMFPYVLLYVPVWFLFLLGIYSLVKKRFKINWIYSLIFITFLYLSFELKPIGINHDYYFFPFMPWLYILVGLGVEVLRTYSPKGIYVVGILLISSTIYTPTISNSKWDASRAQMNMNIFTYSEDLKNAVPNDEHCIILNDGSSFIFSYRIDKMGHIFKHDNLPIEWVSSMVRSGGIRYMYSDSRKIDESKAFQKYIDKVLLVRGNIKVFKLKVPD